MLLSGCAGAMGPKPEELVAKKYALYEGSKDKIKLSKPNLLINDDGSLRLSTGDIIMDEEGSIVTSVQFSEKIFYVVYGKNTKTLKLKDKKGVVIKEFEDKFRFTTYQQNGNLYIATTSEMDAKLYRNQVYSNLFMFDGNSVKLVKKNIQINGYVIAGRDAIAKLSESDFKVNGSTLGNDYEWKFYNISDDMQNDIKPSLVPHNGYSSFNKKLGYQYSFMVGFVGDIAVYTYNYKFNNSAGQLERKTILEAQNLSTGHVAILLDNGDQPFSFLTNGKDVVFKQGVRLIDLRTLKTASIDNNFFPIQLRTGYKNMGGGINWSTYDEYTSDKLSQARGVGKNLFVKD